MSRAVPRQASTTQAGAHSGSTVSSPASASTRRRLFAPSGGATYGGASRIDSGLPFSARPPNTFKVKFTKPGVYRYFCDIHAGMIGYVVVKPKSKPVPTARQDAAVLTKHLTKDVLGAAKLLKVKQPANHVSLGESNSQGVELLSMFPAQLTVKAGTVVSFSMSADSREVHTATFGPSSYLKVLSNAVGGPTPDAQAALYPSSNTGLGPIQLDATSHRQRVRQHGRTGSRSDYAVAAQWAGRLHQAGRVSLPVPDPPVHARDDHRQVARHQTPRRRC